MRKIYREKSSGDVLFFRPTKYLFIIAAVLLAGAVVITLFVRPAGEKAPDENIPAPAAEEEAVTIDNEWAMFLVNSKNPLPYDYDGRISTSAVYSDGDKEYLMDSRAAKYMKDMLSAAEEDGIELIVVSAYRTMEYQQKNFDDSVKRREDSGMTHEEAYAETIRQVAFPGESEHNAGLSADILSAEHMSLDDDGFKDTEAYKWLCGHAAEYGFILRYPQNKYSSTGFIFEPWHYRFIGVYYAKEVAASGLSLEEYYYTRGWLDKSGKAVMMTGPVDPNAPEDTSVQRPEQTVTVIV